MISAGLYNNTLTLQTLTRTSDSMGGWTEAWADSGQFRARIRPLTSAERLTQDKVTGIATHRIYCDNMTVTLEDRIKWGSYYFEIIGIRNPSEAYHHLEIEAKEID